MLFLDCGNTALKCLFNDQITSFLLSDHHFSPSFECYIKNIAANTKVVFSSVSKPNTFKLINNLLNKHFKHDTLISTTEASYNELKNGYEKTEQLGVDRWLAMIATQHIKTPRIIIDAGSWIKMDVVLSNGQHQGGVIISKSKANEAELFKRFALNPSQCSPKAAHYGTSTKQCLCLAHNQYGFKAINMILSTWLTYINMPTHIIVSGGDALKVIYSIENLRKQMEKRILDIKHSENLVLSGLSMKHSN